MKRILIIIASIFFITTAMAEKRVVDLVIDYKKVNFTGKTVVALAANNQIPAPILHFKEGDQVTINVHNKLKEETAMHWHGIIVPWQMDGVLGISQRGIQPGAVFHYQFTLHQAGTYWYHAHAGLQEQQGLYSAIIIDPIKHPPFHYTKDYVIVLSDWSNTRPENILENLKKEGDYYSPRFPLQPSLMKFIHDYRNASTQDRRSIVEDYKMMQQMRMSIYDFSDVAYDAFLLNGQTKAKPWTAPVKIGDVVRLRFIGAGGSTIFHVKIPGTSMQIAHVDGNDIKPYTVSDFTVAPGETFDVLVKIQKNEPYIIYAESNDTLGAAYGALVTSSNQFVGYDKVEPFAEPKPVTQEMMGMMMGSKIQGSLPSNKMVVKDTVNIKSNQSSPKHTMSPGMKMDGMKMDDNMPMDHSMRKKETETSTDIQSESKMVPGSMAMDMSQKNENPRDQVKVMPMSHSMPMNMNMNQHGSHNMSSMPMMSMNAMSSQNPKAMSGMNMDHGMHMSMPTESTIFGDSISAPSSFYETSKGTKYDNLIARVKTNNPNKPVAGVIKMELFGYMDRYIWFINGIPEDKAHPVILEPGKRYRFVFTNTSMMHHPMHIHGHWFILRKGNGSYDPLLHTIDVAPGATITADLDTDASGQWIFHCHMLYHMLSGMARTFQYSTLIEITKDEAKPQDIVKNTAYDNRPIVRVDEVRPIPPALVKHPMMHEVGLWLATFLDIGADPFNNVQRVTYKGLYGRDYNKLELFMNDAEMSKGTVENADIDIFYWHLISQFWAVKGGVNYYYRPATTPYWQPGIGVEGLMPYFIDTNVRGYVYSGSAKLDAELSRDTQITNNFFIRLGIRSILASKTVPDAAIGTGLNQMRYIIRPYYRLIPGLNLVAEYEHVSNYGAFKNIQLNDGGASSENTLTLGVSLIF